MNRMKYMCLVVSICLSTALAAWGQAPNAPVVYVATGQSQIYAVSTGGSDTITPLISTGSPNYNAGAAYTSLAIGPDNSTDNNSGSGSGDLFFLYACDRTNGTIVRLQLSVSNPGTPATNTDFVTNTVPTPVCGRVDATGDLYVSSATAGQGVWVIPGVSTTTGGATYGGAATQVPFTFPAGTSLTGGGITQKNVGDMLLVDTSDGQILKATFNGGSTPFANDALTQYVTGLSSPMGIARAEVPEPAKNPTTAIGDFFVLNLTRQGYALLKFDPSTLPKSSVCLSSPNGNATLTSVAASEDNFLYVGVGGNSKKTWALDILNASSCQSAGVGTISLSTLASPTGVAVPPVSAPPILTTYPTDPSSGVTVNSYNFGSSLLNIAPGSCALTNVTQMPTSASFLESLIGVNSGIIPPPTDNGSPMGSWNGGTGVAGNGEGGFVTVYHVTGTPDLCTPADIQTNMLIDAFYDTNAADTTAVLNPRVIHCEDGFPSSPTCDVIDATGNWPQGGYLPDDQTSGGKIKGFGSLYFLANGTLDTTALGDFCAFETPLNGATQITQTLSSFNSGQGLSVKFKLGTAPNGCTTNSYITDAVALLSITQVLDGKGNPTFVPITISTQGNSTSAPPIFKFNQNSSNYQFSLSLKGYAKGTYALLITFLTNNAQPVETYFTIQ